jgi:hypothetical protein
LRKNTPLTSRFDGNERLETGLKHPHGRLHAMLYAAKCYWPGVNQIELEHTAARAIENSSQNAPRHVRYLGSLLFRDDELVLCMFEAPSCAAVKRASELAGIPCERVMASVWLRPHDQASAPTSETTRA